MAIRTQGSALFLLDSYSTAIPAVLKLHCPTGITGLGGPADQIDSTCLDDTDRSFLRGLGNPGAVNVPFNFDPVQFSHQILFDLKEDGRNLQWAIGLSDGADVPTVNSDGDNFEYPTTRTFAAFQGYVSDVNIDIATNEIVRGTLVVQRSGVVSWSWKA